MYWVTIGHKISFGSEAGYVQKGKRGTYHVIMINGKNYKRSRLVWLWVNGSFPENQIEHKNRDSLDDSWNNLICATPARNQWNKNDHPKKKNFGLPKGVQPTKNGKRFFSTMRTHGKDRRLGTFDTIEEAAEAYRIANEERIYNEDLHSK